MIEAQRKFLMICYSWIQVSDLQSVGGNTLIFYLSKREQLSNNTLLHVYFYIKLGKKYLFLVSVKDLTYDYSKSTQ